MSRAAVLALAAVAVLGACSGPEDAVPSPATTEAPVVDPDEDAADPTGGGAGDAPASTSSATTSPSPAPSTAPSTVVTTPTSEVAGTTPDEGDSLGRLGDTQTSIETEDGSVQIGSGTIPAAASDVPVPDGLVIQLASDAGDSAGFSGTSPLDPDAVAAFYLEALPAAGFQIAEDQQAGPARFIVFVRDGEVGQIAISDTPGAPGSTIVVAFGPG